MKRLQPLAKLRILPIVDIVKHNKDQEKKFKSPLEKPKRENKNAKYGISFYK